MCVCVCVCVFVALSTQDKVRKQWKLSFSDGLFILENQR